MSGLLESLNLFDRTVFPSMQWLRATNVLCAAGIVAALVSAWTHARRAIGSGGLESPATKRNVGSMVAVGLLAAAFLACFVSVWNRYIEVNHFPSQTMSEVLVVFSLSLLFAMLVLHFALNLRRIGQGWAIVDDALMLFIFAGSWAVNVYTTTLSTAQRDLPPALQSYWFPPHLAALIFSYSTLYLAGLICLVYFAMRFWSTMFDPARGKGPGVIVLAVAAVVTGLLLFAPSHLVLWVGLPALVLCVALGGRRLKRAQWKHALLLIGMLSLVPFAHMVTLPVVVIAGVVFLVLRMRESVPGAARLASIEAQMDQVSYVAFSVGFPFLTAGLFMGAFWAQEAWANYWGWDSKENSALITWLVYVIYVHVRMLGGYRGEKAMAVLMGGALSVFLTFQVFGYLPDSQKSLHRYTDDGVVPSEGQMDAPRSEQARREEPAASERGR